MGNFAWKNALGWLFFLLSLLRFSFFSRDLGAIKGGHCGDVRSFLRDVSNECIWEGEEKRQHIVYLLKRFPNHWALDPPPVYIPKNMREKCAYQCVFIWYWIFELLFFFKCSVTASFIEILHRLFINIYSLRSPPV